MAQWRRRCVNLPLEARSASSSRKKGKSSKPSRRLTSFSTCTLFGFVLDGERKTLKKDKQMELQERMGAIGKVSKSWWNLCGGREKVLESFQKMAVCSHAWKG
jgi:hypothetical protein